MKEKHSRKEYPSAEEKELHVVRNHKDTVFRLLYQNREKLLELYNALNGTAYEDTGAVEICTLENVIYMEVKNDVSFLFDSQMSLYEHQSSFCLLYTSAAAVPLSAAVWESLLPQAARPVTMVAASKTASNFFFILYLRFN